jgi:transcriptional regulator with XRE-family HTH domain
MRHDDRVTMSLVGERLKKWLLDKGASQGRFAAQIGSTQGHISKLVAGERRPGLRIALAIEDATHGAVPAASWNESPPRSPAPSPSTRRKSRRKIAHADSRHAA